MERTTVRGPRPCSNKGYWPTALFLCLSALLLAVIPSPAFGSSQGIDKVRLALLYRITQFTIWPDKTFNDESSNLHICFLGEKSGKFAELFRESTKDKSSQGRGFQEHGFTTTRDMTRYLSEGKICHYLHVIAGQKVDSSLQKQLRTMGTVISGETEESLEQGALLAMMVESGKLRIFISKEELKAQSVSFDSRLLALARMR